MNTQITKAEIEEMVLKTLNACLEKNDDISDVLYLSNGYDNSEFVDALHKSYLIGDSTSTKKSFRCETQLCVDENETYILYGFIKDVLEEDMDFSEFPLTTVSAFAEQFENKLNDFIESNMTTAKNNKLIALYEYDGIEYQHLCDTRASDFLEANRHEISPKQIAQIKGIEKDDAVVLVFYLGHTVKVLGI
jgi:hypothetical protein